MWLLRVKPDWHGYCKGKVEAGFPILTFPPTSDFPRRAARGFLFTQAEQGASMRKPIMLQSSLAREISLMLILKALVLYGIWYVFFSHPAVPSMIKGMDAAKVGAAIVGPARAELNPGTNQPSGETR